MILTLMSLKIEAFPSGPLQASCFLVYDEATNEGVLVDPGASNDKLTKFI